MNTTATPPNELAIIEQDTRRLLLSIINVAARAYDTDDAETLRWLHRRASKLAADMQSRRREAVTE